MCLLVSSENTHVAVSPAESKNKTSEYMNSTSQSENETSSSENSVTKSQQAHK